MADLTLSNAEAPVIGNRDEGNLLRYTIYISTFLLAFILVKSHLIFYSFLLIWSLKGAKHSMISICLINLMVLLNVALVPSGSAYKALWWFSMMVFSFRIIVDAARMGYLSHQVLPSLLFYSLVVLFLSLFSSNISVSIAKIFSFSMVSTALLLGFRMTLYQSFDWENWFLASWLSVFVFSIPTLLLSEIGYFRDSNGFQGILNHPQVFGIYLSTACGWMFFNTFFSTKPSKIIVIIYMIALFWFMLLTKARTALVSFSISFILLLIFSFGFIPRWGRYVKKMFYVMFVFALVLLGAIFFSSSASGFITDFFLKKNEAGDINQAFSSSRGQIVEESWANFLEYPLYGIGFGITKNENTLFEIDPRTGLPISFTTEKAMLPVVLLEETGLIGFFAFLPFMFMMMRYVFASNDLKLPMVFLTAITINIGEMVFFSIGGVGLYLLIQIFWVVNAKYMKEYQ